MARRSFAMGVALLVAATVSSAASCSGGHVAIGAVPTNVPTLRGAAALGTLVRVDARALVAEFRLKCGWYYRPKQRIRPGLWKVPLRHLTFGWETNLRDPARGSVKTVSRTVWLRLVERQGWSGTLRLLQPDGSLSNGPTTDICGGDFG